ncbi:helix-turn-helix transcriptional regulator [Mucilaginibacter ginsenosidivorans]|uniref:Helix-turn-helix transcriptional regulator n=2 Tax=Mucilaginibacter ginsenosidivorans TaxID=398053 RepID=A0A5B8USB4_9SPHI|nr:helix-turn-helix transcriptional regulator [Mucilaginibacter ginsenosidivorans]
MERGLLQKAVAEILNVDEDSITAWENGRSKPQVRFYPKILAFLQYNPFNHDIETVSGRLRHVRLCNGYSIKRFAQLVHVDPVTFAKLECGKRVMSTLAQLTILNLLAKLPTYLRTNHFL